MDTEANSRAGCSTFGRITTRYTSTSAEQANRQTTVSWRPSTARYAIHTWTCTCWPTAMGP